MTAAIAKLGHWFAELRRRKVVRVAIAYLVAAWLVIQVADATFEPMGLPANALRLVIVVLGLGFPLACGLAWAFDITARGIERTTPLPEPNDPSADPQPAVQNPPVASVAVLPFADLSPNRDQGYFCDGIAEELINSLCCVGGLRVASRTSSFQFRDRQADAREIGRLLGVGAVLEGGVRKAGTRVRITAQLVNCADGYQHWSESFDRDLDDVFALQSEIARKLVAAMRLALTPQESALLERGGTANAAAYDLYLRGQAMLRDHTDSTLPKAAELFRQAIRADADFAQAHAGLANALAVTGQWQLGLEPAEFEEAIRASQRALDLQPQMPEAYVASACLYSMQGRVAEAETAFEAALRLNPASYDANYMYARHSFAIGNFERAARYFEAAHDLRPDEYQPLSLLLGTLVRLGRTERLQSVGDRAMAAIERRLALDPSDGRALHLGAVLAARLGQETKSRDWAARALIARPGAFATAYNLACAYSLLGDHEQALQMLDAAVESGRGNLGWIEHDPDFDPLRGKPRFDEIVNRLRKKP